METEGIVDFWIGVNDKANEGNFVYASDNSSIAWNDWADGQPNSYKGNQDCVAVINERMGWDDRQCNGADVFHFACVRGGKCQIIVSTYIREYLLRWYLDPRCANAWEQLGEMMNSMKTVVEFY